MYFRVPTFNTKKGIYVCELSPPLPDEIMSEFRGVGKITLSIIIVFVIATAFYAMFDIILNSKVRPGMELEVRHNKLSYAFQHYGTTTVALQVLCKCLLTALNTFGPASASM